MRINDAHLHLFLPDRVIDILQNSQYKNKYKLYNAINQSIILNPTNYVETIDNFFAIPIIFKEINIEEENKYVLETCDSLKKGIPVTLIDINENFKGNYNYLIFKEHFLLHKFDEWKNRSLYYEYLNEKEGFLILHCKDNIRLEYINELLKNFPKMNIIVAHLGRDIYEDSNFIFNILDSLKFKDNVFFDISTINNFENILTALNMISFKRIFYGSDYPYEFNFDSDCYKNKCLFKILKDSELEAVMGENFERIKKRIYK